MKSSVLVFLSLLLTTTIIAPAIITLVDLDTNTNMVMDFNEEEKKEEKKETAEKDFLFSRGLNTTSSQQNEKTNISEFYLDSNSTASIAVFLHPPRRS